MKMRFSALSVAGAVALALALTGCASAAPSTPDATNTPVEQPAADARTGSFEGLNDKNVAGTVSVSATQIVLSGYSSDEGPDLHIYLTNGTDEAAVSAGVDVSTVAFDSESQSFDLTGIDVSKYDTVVIYCNKVNATFGAASLS